MPRRIHFRLLLAATLPLGALTACRTPMAEPPLTIASSSAPSAGHSGSLISLPLGGLSFPDVSRAETSRAIVEGASEGDTRSADIEEPAPAVVPTADASPEIVWDEKGADGATEEDAAAATASTTARVATEPELRAALADTTLTLIELTADIDVTADATTRELAIERGVTIDGGDHVLTADQVTIPFNEHETALKKLCIPYAVVATSAESLSLTNCLLGGEMPQAAFTADGGNRITLTDCRIAGGNIGVKVRAGAVVTLTRCKVETGTGATVNGATFDVDDGTFANASLGINVIDSVVTVKDTAFTQATSCGISVTSNGTGNSLSVDGSSFTDVAAGVRVGGSTAQSLRIRTNKFTRNATAFDLNFAFNTWTATLTGNTFTANGATDVGVDVQTANPTPGLAATWRTDNTFTGFTAGKDIVGQP